MELLGPIALLLSGVGCVGLVAALLLWQPASAAVHKRVEILVGGAEARARDIRGEVSIDHAWMDVFKRFFMSGMRRKWGVDASSSTLMLAGVTASSIAWLLSHTVLELPVWMTTPLMAVAFWCGPHFFARMEQGEADKRFVELFPEAIDMIVRMLRAGLPVSAAIRTVAQEASAPISDVFASLADQIDIGISFEDALRIGSERIGLPDFRFFGASVALQHTTGGNLVATLEILGEIVRRRRTVRMKARAATAEVRVSAYVLGSMPFFVFGALIFVSPAYLRPLIDDPRGNVILVVAFCLLLLAFLVMRYMMRTVVRV